jgi:rhamnose transport system substrate-binding protein
LGYLSTYATHLLVSGELKGNTGDKFTAGRMGEKEIVETKDFGKTVLLGPPFEFNKDNIEEWAKVY